MKRTLKKELNKGLKLLKRKQSKEEIKWGYINQLMIKMKLGTLKYLIENILKAFNMEFFHGCI